MEQELELREKEFELRGEERERAIELKEEEFERFQEEKGRQLEQQEEQGENEKTIPVSEAEELGIVINEERYRTQTKTDENGSGIVIDEERNKRIK